MYSRRTRKRGEIFFDARAPQSDQKEILRSTSSDEYDDKSAGIDISLNSLCLVDVDVYAESVETTNKQYEVRAQSYPLQKTKFPLLARLDLPTKDMRIKKAWSEQEIVFPKVGSELKNEEVKPKRRSRNERIENETPRLFSRKLPSIDDGHARPKNSRELH